MYPTPHRSYSSAAGDVWRSAMEALLASLPQGYLRCCLAFLNGNAKSVRWS